MRYEGTFIADLKTTAMQFDFRQTQAELGYPPRRPPNYFSRRMQWRLFTLIGSLMLVLFFIREARKPESWNWLWAFQQQAGDATAADDASGGRGVDTRLVNDRSRPPVSLAAADVVVAGPDAVAPPVVPAESSPVASSPVAEREFSAAVRDAWKHLLGSILPEEKDLLQQAIAAAHAKTALPADQQAALRSLLDHGGETWRGYVDYLFGEAAQLEASLNESQKAAWEKNAERLQAHWAEQVQPPLASLAAGERPTDKQLSALDRTQDEMLEVFLQAVQDNTVFRTAEKEAWFNLLEKLSRAAPAELKQHSAGTVSFLQLFKQPREYRGKLVTVRGQLRLGYYRPGPKNVFGIPGYYILWLKPAGSDSPIVVYSLELPAGFPDVQAMEDRGEEPKLAEDVEITGYFFKRWAYRAKDDTRLAPLLLAKVPDWTPPPAPTETNSSLPGAGWIAAGILGLALFGIGVAWYAYRASTRVVQRPQAAKLPDVIAWKPREGGQGEGD